MNTREIRLMQWLAFLRYQVSASSLFLRAMPSYWTLSSAMMAPRSGPWAASTSTLTCSLARRAFREFISCNDIHIIFYFTKILLFNNRSYCRCLDGKLRLYGCGVCYCCFWQSSTFQWWEKYSEPSFKLAIDICCFIILGQHSLSKNENLTVTMPFGLQPKQEDALFFLVTIPR